MLIKKNPWQRRQVTDYKPATIAFTEFNILKAIVNKETRFAN